MLKVVINKHFKKELKSFIIKLPEIFNESGETIFAARNIIKVFDVNGMRVNVKSFQKPHLFNQLMYATFRKSKAERSYKYAHKLEERGFNTPTPLAYMEQQFAFLLKRSAYISINEDFDGKMQELRHGTLEGRENLIRQFALFTAELHKKRVLHLDYSSGNILYKKNGEDYSFYLVDLNRMKFDGKISLDTACHNFRRLWGSDDMIIFFIKEYAKARHFNEKLCLEKTFKYRERFWKFFNRKHPFESPYIAE
ncbi:lipopolysaccharide kinase InaA family protein [Dysgonomonas sp. ZJ279]|uniref:lipopolysaccharide kinase InaA family protein n=1 Tax=Dysgonomonas sp. ZJ279 TaxID=2709796 RepID=UPI0013EDB12F|nr:lipopolysaccharide kinase InaA family protein [Dysgonomonas sp. ZJ279]